MEDHLLADPGRAESTEQLGAPRRPFLPLHGPEERLEKHQAAHPVRVARRPVQGERAAPVVADQDDVPQGESVEPGVQVTGVIGESVGNVGLTRFTHADQIRRQAEAMLGDAGKNAAPHAGRHGIAVQKHDGRTSADLTESHERIQDLYPTNAGVWWRESGHDLAPRVRVGRVASGQHTRQAEKPGCEPHAEIVGPDSQPL